MQFLSSLAQFEDLNDELDISACQLLEARRLGHSIEVVDNELHCLFAQAHGAMLVAGMEDGGRVVAVYVVYDGLFTHELKPLDSKEISCFE